MSFTHLSPEERFCIVKCVMEKKSIHFITHFLLRSPSTFSREIKRNSVNKLTTDNGSEFAEFKRLGKATKSRIYLLNLTHPGKEG